MEYGLNGPVTAEEIADLRQAVGWNRMEEEYGNPRLKNFLEITCRQEEKLIGYLCAVSNGVTDAYIQDVMVHPGMQGQGIGSELMRRAIQALRNRGIYMISVIYGEEELRSFYERFGFRTMLCGQMETRKSND